MNVLLSWKLHYGENVRTIKSIIGRFRTPSKSRRFTYQPTDENGRPMGGLQVIKYTDPAELPALLAKQSELLMCQIAKSNREKELGAPEGSDDAEKFEGVTEFRSRDLTADERVRLSQQLLDPERAAEARDLLVESALGAHPTVIAKTLNDLNRFMVQQQAVDSYVTFTASTPEYHDSAANRATLTGWMSKRNWKPTVDNFNRAYRHLVGKLGLLEQAPEVVQVGRV